MLNFYLQKGGEHVLLVEGAELPDLDNYRVDRCRLSDVLRVGGGIYDAIVFPNMPTTKMLEAVITKVYWGGYVIVLGISETVEKAGYLVMKGSPDALVLRRPPPPDDWSIEYYLDFQKPGKYWNKETHGMHPNYPKKFNQIDAKWRNAICIEYGCGRGEVTWLIAKAGTKQVYALDNSPAAIQLTQEFCADCPNVLAIHADALSWQVPQKADVIVAIDFVEHIQEEDLPRLFQNWHDNLKDGGLVYILTPLGPDAVRDHKWAPSPSKLRGKMKEAGFSYKRHVIPEDSRKFYVEFLKKKGKKK